MIKIIIIDLLISLHYILRALSSHLVILKKNTKKKKKLGPAKTNYDGKHQ